MAQGVNKITLIGNLGKNPDLRSTKDGRAVLNWRMATTQKYLDKDGNKQESTQWHNCVLWGKRAEGLAEFLSTGSRVYVEGRLEYRDFEDKDGNKRTSAEINVSDVVLLDGAKKDGDASDENRSASSEKREGFAVSRTSGGGKASNGAKKAAKPEGDDDFHAPDDTDSIPF